MTIFEKWHRRWLHRNVLRTADEHGLVTLVESFGEGGWPGWATAAAAFHGRPGTGVRRLVDRWHVRWLMWRLDAMVASGRYRYCKIDEDTICIAAYIEPASR
jgi:hypothetical protein